MVGAAYEDDDTFIREMTGGGGKSSRKSSYGFDAKTAQKIYTDYRSHKSHHKQKKRKSFLDELFD